MDYWDDEFEWDEDKNVRNFRRHGIDFQLAAMVFDDIAYTEYVDERRDYGEERIVRIGMVNARCIAVVYVTRQRRRRLISARRASLRERERYAEELA